MSKSLTGYVFKGKKIFELDTVVETLNCSEKTVLRAVRNGELEVFIIPDTMPPNKFFIIAKHVKEWSEAMGYA